MEIFEFYIAVVAAILTVDIFWAIWNGNDDE